MKQTNKFTRALSVLLVILLLLETMGTAATVFAESNTVTGNVIGLKDFRIYDPYEPVNWDTWYQYRGMTHVHTHVSDGEENIYEMIEKYYELGYQILAITDHGTVNYGWKKSPTRHTIFSYQWFVHSDPEGLSSARYDQITSGYGRADGIGMMEVPLGIEQNGSSIKKCHVNTFFADAGDGNMGMNEDWPKNAIERLVVDAGKKAEGVAHINHVGEWSGGNDDVGVYKESFVEDMAGLYRSYATSTYNVYRDTNQSVLSGMELVNTADSRTRNDRVLYDKLLMKLAPVGINVYGYCEDDSHEFSDCNRNANFYILENQTWEDLRDCMRTGTFYACSKNSKGADELGTTANMSIEYPRIRRINVDQDKDQITIECTNANKVRMVADGKLIETYKADEDGDTVTFDLNAYENQINSYVRIYLTGPGGIAYLQPFLLTHTTDTTCTATFTLPSEDTTFVLHDSNGQEVAPINSNYCYTLEAGTYTYTATRFGFVDETESVTVTGEDVAAGRKLTYEVNLNPDTTDSTIQFYVPETIYLSGADNKTFQYYVDRENKAIDSALSTNAAKTDGNVFFFCPNASAVTVSASVCSGDCVISDMRFNNGASSTSVKSPANTPSLINAKITTARYAQSSTTDSVIKWTATYTVNGAVLKAYAYSYVFNTLSGNSSVAAAGGTAKTSKTGSWMHSTMNMTATVWLAGTHSVTDGSYSYVKPYYGTTGSVATSMGQENIRQNGAGLSTGYDQSDGGSTGIDVTGGTGHLNIDTSRVTDLSQVPMLAIGIDINNSDELTQKDGDDTSQYIQFDGTKLDSWSNTKMVDLQGQRIFVFDNATENNKINYQVNDKESILIVGQAEGSKEGRTCTVKGTVTLALTYVNKRALRELVNEEVQKGYQSGMFDDELSTTYFEKLEEAYIILGDPRATQDEVNDAKDALEAASDSMVPTSGTLTVNYKYLDGEVFDTQTVNYECGDTVFLAAARYPGLRFNNSWNAYASSDDPYFSGTSTGVVLYTFDKNMVLEYDYVPIPYTVTYNGATLPETTIYYGETFHVPEDAPELTGYDFLYWTFDLDEEQHQYQPGDTFTYQYETDGVLNAHFSPCHYNVTFDLNGGIPAAGTNEFNTVTVDYDEDYTLPLINPANPSVSRTGYQLYGWKLDVNNTIYPAGFTLTWSFTKNGKLTAQWMVNSYTVSYDANGGSGSIDSETYDYNKNFALPNFGIFTKTGYEQVAWEYSDPENAGNVIQSTAGTMVSALCSEPNGSVTIKAVWATDSYAVHFDSKRDGVTVPDGRAYYGGAYTLPSGIEHAGEEIEGWYKDPECTPENKVNTGDPVTEPAEHTLYAKWIPATYTVTLVSEDRANQTIEVTFGSTYSNLPTYERPGYVFNGWYLDNVLYVTTTSVSRTADHTLVASWSPATYTVSFVTGIVGETLSDRPVTFNTPYGPLETYTKPDQWFRGWRIQGTTTVVTADTLLTTAADHTLEAIWENKQSVTVSFKSEQGVTLANAVSYYIGDNYGELSDAAKTGYTFTGWYYNNVKVTADTKVTATADHDLIGKFTANKYDVTFDSNGGSTCRSIRVTYDATYGGLPAPDKPGYRFSHWALDDSEVNEDTIVQTAEDHALTAVWEVRTYTVTLDPRQDGLESHTITVTFDDVYGGENKKLWEPECPGYEFDGWYYANQKITAETVVSTPANHTLTAKWNNASIQVTFDPVGGSACDPIYVTYGSNYSALPTSTKTGYTLRSWTYGGNDIEAGTPMLQTQTHELTASWTANTYFVSFESNGGSVCDNLLVTYDSTYGNLPTPKKTGKSFAGWVTTPDGSDVVTNNTKVQTARNHTLYATWADLPQYTVSFDLNYEDCGTLSTMQVTYTMSYGELESPARAGFTFDGWYTSASGGEHITATSSVNTQANHTLYAHWNPLTYTVTLDPANGDARTGFTMLADAKYGDPLYTPTRYGYTFAGWKYDDTTVSAESGIVVYANHLLTAAWTPNKVTVKLDATTDGTVDPTSVEVDFGGYYTGLPTPTALDQYKTFGGWYLDETTPVNSSVKVTKLETHTLTAHWIEGETYQITFNSNGGSACDPVTVRDNSSYYDLLPKPNKPGYTFTGWQYTLNDATHTVRQNDTYLFDRNMEFTANYTPAIYTVTLVLNYVGAPAGGTIKVQYNAKYLSLFEPTTAPEGYQFEGWYYGNNTEPTTVNSTVTLTEDHTLTAHWIPKQVTVYFYADGGSCSVVSTNFSFNQPYGTLPVPEKAGFRFLGWKLGNFSSEYVTEKTIVTIPEEHQLVAGWEVLKTCTLAFDPDGGTAVASQARYVGDPYVDLPTSEKTGYRFGGWMLENTLLTDTDIIVAEHQSTVNLKAYWVPISYIVSFDSKGGTAFDSISVLYGKPYGELPRPEKADYIFVGWTYADSVIDEDTQVSIAENHTLVAEWKELKYTVTWIVDGVSTPVEYKPNAAIFVVEIPAKTGYTAQWNADIPQTMPEYDLVFTAIYSPISYTITYLGMDGAVYLYEAPQKHVYGTETSIPNVRKEGYTFSGWKVNNSDDSTATVDLVLHGDGFTDNITLTAVWKIDEYRITLSSTLGGYVRLYKKSDGKACNIENGVITVDYGTELLVKPVSACGYELSELYITVDGVRTTLKGDYAFTASKDVEITAIYAAADTLIDIQILNGTGTVNARKGAKVPMYGMVTVCAIVPESTTFAYWAVGSEQGPILSYNEVYTFSAVSDLKLVAVFTDSTVTEKTAGIYTCEASETHVTTVNKTNSLSYYGILRLPADCEIDKIGFLLINADKADVKDTDFVIDGTVNGAKVADFEVPSVNWSNGLKDSGNGLVKVSINRVADGQVRTGRFYLIYTQNGVTKTVYSDTFTSLTA